MKIVFRSDDLAAELDDRARFLLWRDLFTSTFGSFDVSQAVDRPFVMRSEFRQFGVVRLMSMDGAVGRIARSSRDIAAGGSDDFYVNLHRSPTFATANQLRREAQLERGTATLLANWEPGELCGAGCGSAIGFVVPRGPLLGAVARAEDLIAKPFASAHPIALHLHRYAELLIGSDGVAAQPDLMAHVGTTMLDLVALLLGAGRDAEEIARMRGLRSARAREILVEISSGFADPAFSPSVVGAKLGLSARYIQDLLQESGSSFTERVLELRLQKARRMLESSQHDRRNVSEIALECGFNEPSYFNRCFRHRFGDTPTAFRRSNDGTDDADQ
jgi:AraC-like DNA-binding protein